MVGDAGLRIWLLVCVGKTEDNVPSPRPALLYRNGSGPAEGKSPARDRLLSDSLFPEAPDRVTGFRG